MTAKAAVPFFVAMMILTGAANTLLSKYQDKQCFYHCDDPDPARRRYFEQPVLQTAQMFVGEMSCWLVVAGTAIVRRLRAEKARLNGYEAVGTADVDDDESARDEHECAKRSATSSALDGYCVLLLALLAICDIIGTTLMNAGLLIVAASIYQMTRGALVLFVGLFSVVFLRRRLHPYHWVSLFGVVLGVAVVGLAGAISPDAPAKVSMADVHKLLTARDQHGTDASAVVLGVVLIAGGQIFAATQFVLEEWILSNSAMEPVVVVGWEGTFGLPFTLVGMIVLHLAIGRTPEGSKGPFDAVEGWRQITSRPEMIVSSFLIMLSIAGFNFFGLSVTQSVSATARSTIDTCRTLFIWMISLGLGWETFKWLQVVGFAMLVYFTFLFNGLVQPPLACLRPKDKEVRESVPDVPVEFH